MAKLGYHPQAYLSRKRNVRRGLISRTQILTVLENRGDNAQTVAKETKLNYGVVLHHLRLLEAEGYVSRRNKRPIHWNMTGLGQQRLKT
jgi:predicted ArsR family transcriptional regulator